MMPLMNRFAFKRLTCPRVFKESSHPRIFGVPSRKFSDYGPILAENKASEDMNVIKQKILDHALTQAKRTGWTIETLESSCEHYGYPRTFSQSFRYGPLDMVLNMDRKLLNILKKEYRESSGNINRAKDIGGQGSDLGEDFYEKAAQLISRRLELQAPFVFANAEDDESEHQGLFKNQLGQVFKLRALPFGGKEFESPMEAMSKMVMFAGVGRVGLPDNVIVSLESLMEMVEFICREAGDQSYSGNQWYWRRVAVSTAYVSSDLYMAQMGQDEFGSEDGKLSLNHPLKSFVHRRLCEDLKSTEDFFGQSFKMLDLFAQSALRARSP